MEEQTGEDEGNTSELILTLGDDVDRCLYEVERVVEEAKKNPTATGYDDCQFHSRQLIRAIFAFIEAVTFSTKLKAVMYCGKYERGLTDVEVLFAMDREYEITDKGEVVGRPARIRLADNIRFAFVLQERALGTAEKFDANTEWWSNLKTAIKVRDRLMHPKWPKDVHITGEEAVAAVNAYHGFRSQVVTSFAAIKNMAKANNSEHLSIRVGVIRPEHPTL